MDLLPLIPSSFHLCHLCNLWIILLLPVQSVDQSWETSVTGLPVSADILAFRQISVMR